MSSNGRRPRAPRTRPAIQNEVAFLLDLPRALLAVGQERARGASKWGRDTWKGISEADHMAHISRHLLLDQAGDESEAHLEHACLRLLMLLECRADTNCQGRTVRVPRGVRFHIKCHARRGALVGAGGARGHSFTKTNGRQG